MVLVENSTLFDLVIPGHVENKIRHLCSRVHDIEWSGILFYTVEGSFKDENFKATCLDILPMDVGTATFTNFNDNPDVINYRMEHGELMNENVYEALIHSHNNMSAFFSGTDVSTLQEEGEEMPHFLSLIVNNAGKYVARVTRRVHSHVKIEGTLVTTVSSYYDTFNNQSVTLDEDKVETHDMSKEEDTVVLEYYNLNIIKEEGEYYWKEIDDRVDHIKSSGAKAYTYPYTGNYNGTSYNKNSSAPFQGGGQSRPSYLDMYEEDDPYNLFGDDVPSDPNSPVYNNSSKSYPLSVGTPASGKSKLTPKYELLRKAAIRLLTLSFVCGIDKTTAYEAANQIDNLATKEFGTGVAADKAIEGCVDIMVDYVVAAYQDTEFVEYMSKHPEELPKELGVEGDIIVQDAPAIMAWYIADYLKGLKQGRVMRKIIESLKLYYELQ